VGFSVQLFADVTPQEKVGRTYVSDALALAED
jgi:hypothetical protein